MRFPVATVEQQARFDGRGRPRSDALSIRLSDHFRSSEFSDSHNLVWWIDQYEGGNLHDYGGHA
jgi:hypothetical protein